MISKKDQEKLGRVEYLEEVTSWKRLLVPIVLILSTVILMIGSLWGNYDINWGTGVVLPALGIMLMIAHFWKIKSKKKELKKLRKELGI